MERSLRGVEKPAGEISGSAHGVGHGSVRIEAVQDDAAVDRDDVAVLEDTLGIWDTVNDLFIDGGTERGGVAVISLEGGLHAELRDACGGSVFQIHGGRAGLHDGGDGVVDLAQDAARSAHRLDLAGGFDHDGH